MSGSLLGFLRVNLAMDTAQFGAGAARARGELGAIGKAAGAAAAAMATAGAGLAAFASRSAEAAAQTKGLATLANAGMVEFQRMAAAAKTVGIENDQLADILRDVQDRVGDFLANGGGEMSDFFEKVAPRVGVTAEQFRNLSGPEALQLYVSSLEKANLSQAEMTFYLEGVASEATALLPLLKDNGAELNRIADAAGRYGFLSEEAAAAGREMREAQVQLGAAWGALGNALAESGIVEAMARLARTAADFIGLGLAPAVQAIGESMRGMALALDAFAPDLLTSVLSFDRLASYAGAAAAIIGGRLVIALGGATAALVGLRVATLRSGWFALVVVAGELVHQIMRVTERLDGLGGVFDHLGDIANGAFLGIGRSAFALLDRFRAFGLDLRAIWGRAVKWLAEKWADFIGLIAPSFNAVAEKIGAEFRLVPLGAAAWASSFDGAVLRAEQSAKKLREGALERLDGAWKEQEAAVAALRKALAENAAESEGSADDAAGAWENAADRIRAALSKLDASTAAAKSVAPKTSPLPVPRGGVDAGLAAFRKDLAQAGVDGARDLWGALISGGDDFKRSLAGIGSRVSSLIADRAFTNVAALLLPGAAGATGAASGTDGDALIPPLELMLERFGGALTDGAASTFSGIADDLTDGLGGILGALGDGVGAALSTFASALGGGGSSWASAAGSVLMSALGGLGSAAAGAGTASLYTGGDAVVSTLPQFAAGGAFNGGAVVDAPTLFGLRGGLGLMGEAGPEAILPLSRGADGRLGVALSGGGGGPVSIALSIDARGATDPAAVEAAAGRGAAAAVAAVPEIVRDMRRRGQI